MIGRRQRSQRSRSKGKLDESSGDELADTAILYNVPQGFERLPSSHSLGIAVAEDISRPKSSKSTKTIGSDVDKPLPPVPREASHEQEKQHRQKRPALAKKATNLKAINTKAKECDKPMISPPMLQETSNRSIGCPDLSRPTTSHTSQSAFTPQTSTTDAESLSRKISTLMAQAAAQEEQTKLKTAAYAADAATAKASPLERSKNAFAKASRAIKERLSNGSIDRSAKPKRPLSNRHSSFQESSPVVPPTVWQYETLDGLSRERLDRRIAEGENLSNPKIRSLTGTGNIPRKPLPVYESMRSRSMRSGSVEDPFSDEKEGNRFLPREDYSGFNFNFNDDCHQEKTGHNPEVAVDAYQPMDESSKKSDVHCNDYHSTPRFSNLISGLTQHPDVMLFASRPEDDETLGDRPEDHSTPASKPDDHSTPRVRLESRITADVDNHNSKSPIRSPSVPEHDLTDVDDDVLTRIPSSKSHRTRLSDGSTLSVKRKEATEDLRGQSTPSAKRAKTNSTGSTEDVGLVNGIDDLDAGDERVPLSPRSGNSRSGDPAPETSIQKGLSIFDTGKGKVPERKDDDDLPENAWPRIRATKRSSTTRPSSLTLNSGRGSQIAPRSVIQTDEDRMDVDELQLDDIAYQISGRQR